AGVAATGARGATLGLIVGDAAAQDREDGRGAGVARVRGVPVVEEAAAQTLAAVASCPAGTTQSLVVGQRAGHDGEGSAKPIRHPAARRFAAVAAVGSLAADRQVIHYGAVADRGGAAPGGAGAPGAVRVEPTALGAPQEDTGRIIIAAAGPVPAERHVAED